MQKTKVIFIYGAPAVGKLTTAKLLAEKQGYKILHNHLTKDLVRAVLDHCPASEMLIRRLRFEMLEIEVKEKIKGLVVTGVYAHDYTYPDGKNDEWFVEEMERVTIQNDGEFFVINLTAHKDTLMIRVREENRLLWKKISKTDVLEEVLNKFDFSVTSTAKKNLVLDNTEMKVEDTVSRIIEFIGV